MKILRVVSLCVLLGITAFVFWFIMNREANVELPLVAPPVASDSETTSIKTPAKEPQVATPTSTPAPTQNEVDNPELSPGTVSGTLVDSSGKACVNWTVYANSDKNLRFAFTDEFGQFTISNIPPDILTVHAKEREGVGRAVLGDPITLDSGHHIQNLRLVYDLAHTISGRVTDIDGYPIAEASVKAMAPQTPPKKGLRKIATAKTDVDGGYTLDGITEETGATAEFTVHAKGYFKGVREGVLLDTSGQDFVLRRIPRFGGRVLDSVTGEPIEHYLTIWETRNFATIRDHLKDMHHLKPQFHPDGVFSIGSKSQRDLKLVLFAPGYAPMLHPVAGVLADQTNSGIEILMKSIDPLAGIVTGPTGQPVPNASVVLGIPAIRHEDDGPKLNARPYAVTDISGRFMIDEYPDSEFTICAFSPEFALGSVQATPKSSLIKIKLQRGARMEGHVKLGDKDEKGRVSLRFGDNGHMYQELDVNQRYRFEKVPSGVVTVVSIVRQGRTQQTQRRDVRTSSNGIYTEDFDFTARFDSYVEGKVTLDFKSKTYYSLHADIQLSDGSFREFNTTIRTDGSYRLGPVPAATFQFGPRFIVLEDGTEILPEAEWVTTQPGKTTHHNFTFFTE